MKEKNQVGETMVSFANGENLSVESDMPPFFGPIVMLVNSIYSSASLSAS